MSVALTSFGSWHVAGYVCARSQFFKHEGLSSALFRLSLLPLRALIAGYPINHKLVRAAQVNSRASEHQPGGL